ncbi:hypothetical protein UFOVP1264_13 [uncultured Caudovirales phage]|uniref:Uncharacterized protein n=1 Tax=uncultured Caudovirales phage TaxID=2100421 RepID=A0A6J5RLH6_9CAUD|nr:hypothetical protein UFOVP1264_13 [uncultured Caudovirales phage]
MFKAKVFPITIDQGSTFNMFFTYYDKVTNEQTGVVTKTPVNLTGYGARMMVRSNFTDTTPMLSLTSTAGDIVLGGSAGTISITASATTTASMIPGMGVYDVEIYNGTFVRRLFGGRVEITAEATK